MKKMLKRFLLFAVVLAITGLVIIALMPSPVIVETTRARRGHLQVTIDEEGEARAHDRYIISAPVSGKLQRVDLHDGDPVNRGQVLAVIEPVPIDPKEFEEVTARVRAAEATKREAEARVESAREDYEQARRERQRAEGLARDGLVSTQMFEQAKSAEVTAAKALEAARQRVIAAASEVQMAKAGLIAVQSGKVGAGKLVKVTAPVRGRVMRVVEKSERVVTPGMPILILGDPKRIEIVVDVLSTDAVKIKTGSSILLEGWGDEMPIRAKVRVVEPTAFTKVSALGVEEQRVNVVADFIDSPGALGDGYRVEVRIIIWEGDEVLIVPTSALFRRESAWSVFAVEGGKTVRRDVKVGHRNAYDVEILDGISAGEEIVLHPTNQLAEGTQVEKR
jgi:HlyD family secretion protein